MKTQPGMVTKLCVCGNQISVKTGACSSCWDLLTKPLRQAWLAAKNDEGPAREQAEAGIREHLRKVAVR